MTVIVYTESGSGQWDFAMARKRCCVRRLLAIAVSVMFVLAASSAYAADAQVQQIKLPAACTEFHAAAGGAKIVFYVRQSRKLLVADVLAQKLIGEIPVPGDNASFTCTRDR